MMFLLYVKVSTLLKEFGVIGSPSKTYELISECNKNILINSTVNEATLFNVYSRQKI